MERIKAHPLLDRVYRKMATSVFDQVLAGMREVGDAAGQLKEMAEKPKPDETEGAGVPAGKKEAPLADRTNVEKEPNTGESIP